MKLNLRENDYDINLEDNIEYLKDLLSANEFYITGVEKEDRLHIKRFLNAYRIGTRSYLSLRSNKTRNIYWITTDNGQVTIKDFDRLNRIVDGIESMRF